MHLIHSLICFFFFNDTATTEIYTLSLHDALPISHSHGTGRARDRIASAPAVEHVGKVRRHREVHDAVEIEQGGAAGPAVNAARTGGHGTVADARGTRLVDCEEHHHREVARADRRA